MKDQGPRAQDRGKRTLPRPGARAEDGEPKGGPKGDIRAGGEGRGSQGEAFITKEEVARLIQRPVRTVEDWMRRRLIPFYKLGQAPRFRWSEVQAHFAARYRVEPEGWGLGPMGTVVTPDGGILRDGREHE